MGLRENTINAKNMYFKNFPFKSRVKIRCSIITHHNLLYLSERCKLLRIPFGKRMGQDISEKMIEQAYKNCKGVGRVSDDVQVVGNEKKHMTELHEEKECIRK